jgi:hypothetical protein
MIQTSHIIWGESISAGNGNSGMRNFAPTHFALIKIGMKLDNISLYCIKHCLIFEGLSEKLLVNLLFMLVHWPVLHPFEFCWQPPTV